MNVRLGRGSLAVLIGSLALLGAGLQANAAAAACGAEEPRIVGNVYFGTSCDDTYRMPRSVTVAHGEGGDDTIYGQRGNDRLFGGPGDDRLYGGIGDDQLRGGEGNDLLSGGFGADSVLDGEAGNDLVRGDATIDHIQNTGGGVDTLSYATGATPGFFDRPDPPDPQNPRNSFPDFSAYEGFPQRADGRRGAYVDLVTGSGDNGRAPEGGGFDIDISGAAEFEIVIGTPFADYIVGTDTGQTIYGGGGADVILGDEGADQIYGGAEGDYCEGAITFECEFDEDDEEVEPRDPGAIAVGEMAPDAGQAPAFYLTGSVGSDDVTTGYIPPSEGEEGAVTFTLGAGSVGDFDTDLSAAGGCEPPGPDQVICPLDSAPDSVVLAGLDGDDTLAASGFPDTTSVILLGGGDNDELTGGETEDAVVDGPGNDVVDAGERDDAVPNNSGADDLDAGPGEDLFVSDVVCDGDTLDGGPDRDNANWANFDQGVTIDMAAGKAGEVGAEGQASCPELSLLTDLIGLEDIEGSSFDDVLLGDDRPNQLLGRFGDDSYLAAAGNDHILANSGDGDVTIDCGSGFDTALVDHPPYGDPTPVACESVEARDPNSFRPPDTPPDPDPPDSDQPPAEEPAPPPPVAQPPPPPWLLDRVPPQTWFAHKPPRRVFTVRRRRKVAFVFAANEPARFLCKLDRRALRRCGRLRRFGLRPGRHALRVRAIDLAGNRDRSVALHRFVVRRVSAQWIRTHRRRGQSR
jgi:Ca2+-binding RTX toxin-like protein